MLAGVKIGSLLLSDPDYGCRVITKLKEQFDIPILVDSKILDVAHIVLPYCKRLKSLGADGVTLWGHCGPSVLKECVRLDKELAVVVLTELTEPSARRYHDKLADFVTMAIDVGAHAIQAPGNHPEAIKIARTIAGPSMPIFSCGIGFQGGDPREAISAGADYLIVGREITNSRDPLQATIEISRQISLGTV